jgi:rod shape-determining protein MreB
MSASFALDFGTATTRIATDSGELVCDEPTIAAVEADSGRLLAFGRAALGLGATCGGRVLLVRPVRSGKILDIDLAEMFLAEALRGAGVSRLSSPKMLVCSHLSSTGVQRRAIERALKKAGARGVSFVEQPVACAIGAGLQISEPVGSMVLDLGAGVCDLAVIALGGLVSSASIEVGGDTFDDAVREYLARYHRVIVDAGHAAALRQQFASIGRPESLGPVRVAGRNADTGRRFEVEVERRELSQVLERVAQPIFDAAARCIADAPPDLANDLLNEGLVLAGGGGRIEGFDQRLARTTGVPVHVPPDGELLSVLGAAQCLEEGIEPVPVLSAPRAR